MDFIPKFFGHLYRFLAIMWLIFILNGCNGVIEPNTEERFFFHHKGAELAVQVDGDISSNVFILLLHGGPGGSGYEYNSGIFTRLMEDRYAMVYMDQRGQGASQGNYDKDELTLQLFSDDIAAMVKLLKKKYGDDISLFLAGHSWGGLTGTHALLNTNVQLNLRGWIEIDGAHDIPFLNQSAVSMFHHYATREIADTNNVAEWQEILDFVSTVDSMNVSDDESGKINSYGFDAESYLIDQSKVPEDPESKSWAFLHSPIAPLATLIGNSTASAIEGESETTRLTDRLNEINIPSLFISGKYDFVVPPRLARSAYEEVGTEAKELHIFGNSGHSPMDTEPDSVATVIMNFIEANK